MYSSPTDVKRSTGVQPSDFSLTTDLELDQVLTTWLEQITDLINADRRRDFEAEVAEGTRPEVPAGIEGIALEMAGKMVRLATLRRDQAVVRVDEFTVRVVAEDLLTTDIRRRLARYPAKRRIGLLRVRGPVEVEEAEAEAEASP